MKKHLYLFLAVTLVYAACKKTVTNPSKSNFNAADYSKQLATTLYKSLSGQYGGANISDGIKAPASIATPGHKGVRVNDVNPFCGFTIDTTYTTNDNVGDTSKVYFTRYRFVYGCENNVLNSYSLQDSITNTETFGLTKAVSKLSQLYVVKALDQTYKTSSVEGGIVYSMHTDYNAPAGLQFNYIDSYYSFVGVKVDISSGTADVIAGSANINSAFQYKDATSAYSTSVTGSIQFLGNHMAKVTLHVSSDGSDYAYSVNMVTGETIKI